MHAVKGFPVFDENDPLSGLIAALLHCCIADDVYLHCIADDVPYSEDSNLSTCLRNCVLYFINPHSTHEVIILSWQTC